MFSCKISVKEKTALLIPRLDPSLVRAGFGNSPIPQFTNSYGYFLQKSDGEEPINAKIVT